MRSIVSAAPGLCGSASGAAEQKAKGSPCGSVQAAAPAATSGKVSQVIGAVVDVGGLDAPDFGLLKAFRSVFGREMVGKCELEPSMWRF